MQVVLLLWNLKNEHGQHVHRFCNSLFIFYQIFNGFLVLKPQNSHHLSNTFMAHISRFLLVLCLPLLTFWSSFSWMYIWKSTLWACIINTRRNNTMKTKCIVTNINDFTFKLSRNFIKIYWNYKVWATTMKNYIAT